MLTSKQLVVSKYVATQHRFTGTFCNQIDELIELVKRRFEIIEKGSRTLNLKYPINNRSSVVKKQCVDYLLNIKCRRANM